MDKLTELIHDAVTGKRSQKEAEQQAMASENERLKAEVERERQRLAELQSN